MPTIKRVSKQENEYLQTITNHLSLKRHFLADFLPDAYRQGRLDDAAFYAASLLKEATTLPPKVTIALYEIGGGKENPYL